MVEDATGRRDGDTGSHVFRRQVGELARARRSRSSLAVGALAGLNSFVDAYRLQEGVRIELGAQVIGWKIAAPPDCEPLSALLFDIDRMASDALLEDAGVLCDGIECELALRIDGPLPLGGCTRADVRAAVGAVVPAFELLCSRLPEKFASPREHLVADGLGQGAVVLGEPCEDWQSLDLDTLRVTLWADEVCVIDKQGGNPFKDPLLAVVLLVNHLALRGERLTPGMFVLTGSYTGVHRAQPGQRLRCVFTGIGQVALDASDAVTHEFQEQDHAGG